MAFVVISEWSSRTLAIVNASRSFLVFITQRWIVASYVPNLMSPLLIGLRMDCGDLVDLLQGKPQLACC